MNFIGLIFLLIAHYFSGKGLLRLLKVQLKPVPFFCLSMITGVALLSFAPCVLQLLHISIDTWPVSIAIILFTAVFSIPLLLNYKHPEFKKITIPALYEWPFLIICMLLMGVSIWRCFYLPPYSRDMLSGPELLAEFAVREKTMISSVFTVDLESTNNYFKSPFITSLQIIYKLLVSPFGQVWLSILFVCFVGWLYSLLHERIHPLLASFLLMAFLIIPDLYAYSYVMLYDYSNMIFFFGGFYFLVKYADNNRFTDVVCSAFLFGIATYIRAETLVLVAMVMPILIYCFYKKHVPLKKSLMGLGIFLAVPAAFYVLCIDVFVRNFIPFSFDVSSQVNSQLGNISVFFHRLNDINNSLIFSWKGLEIFGYFIFIFLGVFLSDMIFFRRSNRESLMLLYGIGVIYFGLAFLGYLIPLVDVMNTTKRGLFKAIPFMLLYIANSPSVARLSAYIKKWENTETIEDKKVI